MANDSKHDDYVRCLLAAESSLRGYILGHVGDFSVAEDILQQTAVTLWRKFDTYETGKPFLPWAIGVARIEILNARRRSARPGVIFDSELASKIAETYVELDRELTDRRRALRVCVERLPDRVRSAVKLRYEEGLDLVSISKELGRSLVAIKVLLHRARLALEGCIRSQLGSRGA